MYERFLDPRADGFSDPARWDEVSTLGHTGRRYLSEDELYAAALEREPDATAERRAELRTEAGKAARHNVAFFDVTFSVQKSVTLLHTAFEAQEVAARSAGDEETAAGVGGVPAGGRGRDLGGQQRRPGLPGRARRLLPGRAPRRRRGPVGRRPRLGRGVVLPARLPRPRPAAAHPQRRCSTASQGPDGVWRTLDGRSAVPVATAPPAAVAERTTEERLTHALGRAGRDAPGRQGPRGRRGRRRRRWT